MEQIINEKNIFKKSSVFRLYLILMTLLNVAYVSIEIYKAKISKPMLVKAEITQLEFMKLETLSTYALFCESALIIFTIVSVLLIFVKKYRPFFKSFFVIHLAYLVILFMLSNVLSWIFVAPVGNLTQQLIAPFLLIIGALIYFIIKNFGRLNVYTRHLTNGK